MAKRRTKSSLNKSIANHAQDETEYGQDISALPPGIKNGVAKLTKAHIGEYAEDSALAGGKFLYLGASVVEPTKHTYIPRVYDPKAKGRNKVKNLDPVTMSIKGLLTSPGPMPLCETEKEDEDTNVAEAMNMVRRIGGEDCTKDVKDEEDLAEVLEQILEDEPYVQFSTRGSMVYKQYPEERAWENWLRSVDYENGEVLDEDVDEDEEEDEEYEEEDEEEYEEEDEYEEEGSDEEEEEDDEEEEGDEEEEEDEESEEESDYDNMALSELAALADDEEDTEAQTALEAAAESVDLDPDQYESWADLADAIEEADDEGGEEEDEEEESEAPEKGASYWFKPPKKRTRVKVTCSAVFQGNQTCNVKEDRTGTLHRKVEWGDLHDSKS